MASIACVQCSVVKPPKTVNWSLTVFLNVMFYVCMDLTLTKNVTEDFQLYKNNHYQMNNMFSSSDSHGCHENLHDLQYRRMEDLDRETNYCSSAIFISII